VNRRQQQLRADLQGLDDAVGSVRALSEGALCASGGVAPAAEPVRAPLSRKEVVGYRLVGVIEPGATVHSRRKVVDVSVIRPFELRLTDGHGARVLTERAELLTWPVRRGERRFSRLDELARAAIARQHPDRLEELERQWTVFWFEWVLRPDDAAHVVCRARCVAAPSGAFGTYRRPPVIWQLGAPRGRPLVVLAGAVRRVLAKIGSHPRFMPERLVGVERARRGPRIGI
jgi:hypothetical protein